MFLWARILQDHSLLYGKAMSEHAHISYSISLSTQTRYLAVLQSYHMFVVGCMVYLCVHGRFITHTHRKNITCLNHITTTLYHVCCGWFWPRLWLNYQELIIIRIGGKIRHLSYWYFSSKPVLILKAFIRISWSVGLTSHNVNRTSKLFLINII